MHLPICIIFSLRCSPIRISDKTQIFLLSKTPADMSPVEFQKRTIVSFCGQKIIKSAKISANVSVFSKTKLSELCNSHTHTNS